MTSALSFEAMYDHLISDPAFAGACKRYRRGGSPEAIAMAVLTAIGFPDLQIDAHRYRFLREKCRSEDGSDLDAAIDAEMDALVVGKAGAA